MKYRNLFEFIFGDSWSEESLYCFQFNLSYKVTERFYFSSERAENIFKNGRVINDKKNVDNTFCLNYVDKDYLQKNILLILICSAIFSIILLNANRLNHSYYSYLIAAFMRKIFSKRQDFQAEIRRKHIEEKFSQVRRMSDLDFTTPNDIARHMQLP